jgi:O-antigen ligase
MFYRVTLSRHNNLIGCWHRINCQREFLVALSLAFITQSQLRITALSAGIGELLILSLLFYELYAKLFCNSVKESVPINEHDRISFFGLLFFLIVLGATIFHYHSYVPAMRGIAIHNLLAYMYVALLFLYFCTCALNLELIAWLFAVTLLAMISVEFLIVPKRCLFFDEARFTALSNNPNQLALAVLSLPYIFFRAIITQAKALNRVFNGACLIYSLVCIHFILCDSIFLANLFLACLSIFFIFSRKRQIVYCVVPILILATSLNILPSKIVALQKVVFHSSFSTMIPEALRKLILAYPLKPASTLFESEALFRAKLWGEAITMSQQHPLFGVGAGALVPLSEGKRMEAHNTFLDISIQSGLTGLIVYLAFLVCVLLQIYRKNRLDLLLMFYSLIIFSCFHFILRQPIVWFYFAYLLLVNGDVTHEKRCLSC